ncbi:MAG: hypothetical protein PUA96_02065 [Bacteroidales bacterium]|nr:hypothetical protein [Bacteroidales bacterium]
MDKIENALLSGQLDTALAMLDNIDTASIHTVAGNARYTVLKALAHDKCYIDDGSLVTSLDSLSDWYFHHGSRKERMLYWYYFGDQLFDLARYDEAIVPLARSLDLAQERKDWFYCGLASMEIAIIFCESYVSSEERLFAENAYEYFLKSKSQSHIVYSSCLLARALYNSGKIDLSKEMYNKIINNARKDCDTLMLASSLISSSKCYLIDDDLIPEVSYDRLTEAYSMSASLTAKGWADYAYAACLIDKKDEALIFINNAYDCCTNRHDTLYVFSRNKECQEFSNLGYVSEEGIVSTVDDLMTDIADNKVLIIYNEYNKLKTQLKLLASSRIILILVSIILLIAFLVLSIIVYYQSREKRNLLAIQELNIIVETLERKMLPSDAMRYSFKFFDPVFNEYCHGGDINSNSLLRSFKQMLYGFSREGGAQTEFKDMVDRANDNVISKMRECKVFREEETFLYSMCISGLSYFAIAAILGIDNVSVAKRVARLRSKIQTKVSLEVADELLGKMPMRR